MLDSVCDKAIVSVRSLPAFCQSLIVESVVHSYPCTLHMYLEEETPTLRQSEVLFTQLLEAVLHLGRNGIAHRSVAVIVSEHAYILHRQKPVLEILSM